MSDTPLPTGLIVRPRADACLSFANTLCWRGRQTPSESLRELADVVRWAAGSAGLPDSAVQAWLRRGDRQEREAQRLFGQAIALREAIYRIFSALAANSPVAEADIAALNAALAEAPERRELVAVDGAYAWRLPPLPQAQEGLIANRLDAGGAPLHTFRTLPIDRGLPIFTDAKRALEESMKLAWHKPQVTEQEAGLEVTSYLPAELDRT